MEMNIRRVSVTDCASLSNLAKRAFYETFTGTCTFDDMQFFLEENFNETKLEKEIDDEMNQYYFAEVDGILAGYILFSEDYKSLPVMKQWKALELKRIYVLKTFYGQGIAQKLMEVILDHAGKEQYKAIWLGVWEHNTRAQRFYEKYGFTQSGYTHDFPIGNTPQKDLWLWKFL